MEFVPAIFVAAATANFSWTLAILIFIVASIPAIFLCRLLKLYSDTPQGSAVWLPSAVILTVAALWLLGKIDGSAVWQLVKWALYGLGGLFALSAVLTLVFWLEDKKKK